MTTPRRRWSFTLRTLFVVVGVLACWLGWELHVVRERQEGLRWIKSEQAYATSSETVKKDILDYYLRHPNRPRKSFSVPIVRRLFGDAPIIAIFTFDESMLDETKRLFPEAEVVIDATHGFSEMNP